MLSFACTDLTALAEEIQKNSFPSLEGPPGWLFGESGGLACIVKTAPVPTIYIHPILNRSETPEYLFRHVFIHEMLHLTIPAREVDGKQMDHPPEFWEAERDLSPERRLAWNWLWFNFRVFLVSNKREECTRVRRNWRESLRYPTGDPRTVSGCHEMDSPALR
jgi:hypothetical protein